MTVEALAVCGYVIAVYEVVVAAGIALWPGASDSEILGLWVTAAVISGSGQARVRSLTRALVSRVARRPRPYPALMSSVSGAAGAGPSAGAEAAGEDGRLEGALLEGALTRLAELLVEGTSAQSAGVWLAGQDGLRRKGWWPPGDGAGAVVGLARAGSGDGGAGVWAFTGPGHITPVRDGERLLGALALHPTPGRVLSQGDLRLAADVANAAGLLLRNAELTRRLRDQVAAETAQAEALAAARRRLVVARDAAREQLSAEIQACVCVPLERCARAAERAGDDQAGPVDSQRLAAVIAEMAAEVDAAIGDFRRVVHGVYPPVLTDHGLLAAMENLLTGIDPRAVLVAGRVPRLAARVEAGVYFCVAALLRGWDAAGSRHPLRVAVQILKNDLQVTISDRMDNAGGRAALPVSTVVLEAAQDRTAALGGSLLAESGENSRRLVLRVPLAADDGAPAGGREEPGPLSAEPARSAPGTGGPAGQPPLPGGYPAARRWWRRLCGRTLVYGALIALIGASYVLVVVRADALLGLSTDWLAPPQIVATGLIALAFGPARAQASRWADRLVYGQRKPAYDVLAEVSALSAASEPGEAALSSLARIVAQGLGSGSVSVVLDLPGGLSVTRQWPPGDPAPAGPVHRVPVSYRGMPVGALCLSRDQERRLPRDRRSLFADLSGSVGMILQIASLSLQLERGLREAGELSAELRASRWRVVAAQDSERRGLERDLHDGVQPSLTAVRFALGLASHRRQAGDLAGARQALDTVREQAAGALLRLRQTLRGLNPAITGLRDLETVLREQAESLGASPLLRIGSGSEGTAVDPMAGTAVYFCCAEALQNAVKHSPGAAVEVSADLDLSAGRLCFAITDQGQGFDRDAAPAGGGLQNMADRIGAAGGTLTVRTAPGQGTSVTGWVPITPGPASGGRCGRT